MHALGCIIIYAANYVLIDGLRNEWCERRCQAAEGFKRRIQGHISSFLIRSHLLAPITFASLSHIPVGKIVNEAVKLPACFGYAKLVEIIIDRSYKGV